MSVNSSTAFCAQREKKNDSSNSVSMLFLNIQVLRYFDYVFTGVFTFEMIIKVCHRNTLIHFFLTQKSFRSQDALIRFARVRLLSSR